MHNIELLCRSANGKSVVFDPIHSHTATHFNDTLKLRQLVSGLLINIVLEGDLIAKDFDMGRTIGFSDVVDIDDSDDVVYALRKNREDQGHVPFTKSRSPRPSRQVSVYLVKKDDSTYELLSAWIGKFESPHFPQMKGAPAESIPYWKKHAFVWGSQEIIPETVTSDCPW